MEIKVAKRIKVDNPLILKEEYDSRFSGQHNVITSVLQVEEEGGRIGRRGAMSERLVQLDFKMEKGPITQGIQAASRSWERQRNRFFLRVSRWNCGPANTLILARKFCVRLLTERTIR